MISKTFTFTDYAGIQRKETHYFNITQAEMMQIEMSEKGGFIAKLRRLTESIDVTEMSKIFEFMIDKSYGVRSADGRAFRKTPEALQDFKSTEAYSQLYIELLSNTDEAIKFIKGIMPTMTAEQQKKFDAQIAKQKEELTQAFAPTE